MNQNREWFQANRRPYELLWLEPMRLLLAQLQGPLASLYRGQTLSPPKIFRLNRDVRFSKDKTPYKTSISAVMALEGADGPVGGAAALYCQFGLEDFAGAGMYSMFPDTLVRYRKALLDEKSGVAVNKLVDVATKSGLTVAASETLKRAPSGVAVDHPRIELLKLKGLTLGAEKIPKKVRFSKTLVPWLLEQAAAAAPMVKWLSRL